MESEVNISTIEERLFKDVCSIVEHAKSRVAVNVNAEQNLMFWLIGKRINEDVLGNKRASYGKQIVSTLSTQLQNHYGSREYGVRNLRRMMQFAREFQQKEIVSMMTTQLTWSHIVELLPLKDDLQREFYSTMAIAERWNVKTLRSQMELYLRWLDKNERQEGEESPLGLLLCTEGGDEQIELLQLDMSGIKVAKYYTELPDKKVLQSQLRRQLESAKKRMEQISEIDLLNEKDEE